MSVLTVASLSSKYLHWFHRAEVVRIWSVGSKVRVLFHSGQEGKEMPQSFAATPRHWADFLHVVRGSVVFLLLSVGGKGGCDKLVIVKSERAKCVRASGKDREEAEQGFKEQDAAEHESYQGLATES